MFLKGRVCQSTVSSVVACRACDFWCTNARLNAAILDAQQVRRIGSFKPVSLYLGIFFFWLAPFFCQFHHPTWRHNINRILSFTYSNTPALHAGYVFCKTITYSIGSCCLLEKRHVKIEGGSSKRRGPDSNVKHGISPVQVWSSSAISSVANCTLKNEISSGLSWHGHLLTCPCEALFVRRWWTFMQIDVETTCCNWFSFRIDSNGWHTDKKCTGP